MNESAAVITLLSFLAAYVIFILIWYVLQAIAYWRIFTKAGEAGWKAIIPFYNSYIQYKLCWETKYFWIAFIGGFIGIFIHQMTGGIISLLGGALYMAASLLGLIGTHKLSTAFGHGFGYTIGLIFLGPIFMLILGFGNSEYRGPQ